MSSLRTAALLACLLLASTVARAGEAIRILSYNTHGLPAWIAGGDPDVQFPRIGELTNGFSLALLQEDFAHHELLRRGARHPVVERGNASLRAMCPICSGAGLTTLVNPPLELDVVWNVPYEQCSGWLLGGSDCLASKGFQLARVSVPGGAAFYVVNTHLDAGTDEDDRRARAQQLETLRETLDRQADGAALIVAGDLNLRADDAADRAIFDEFAASLGLVDSGARAAPGTSWEVLDYILFRSGAGAVLELTGAGEDESFTADGEPLSDHPALFAEFTVRAVAAAAASPQRVVEMPPSTGITAPVTYAPAADAR